jgi:hypothetical protein
MITAEQVTLADKQAIEELDRKEQAQLLEMAAGIFLTRERDFWKIATRHDVHVDSLANCIFWDRLHALSESERALQKIFMGSQPSLEQHKLYGRFRRMLLEGSRLEANA